MKNVKMVMRRRGNFEKKPNARRDGHMNEPFFSSLESQKDVREPPQGIKLRKSLRYDMRGRHSLSSLFSSSFVLYVVCTPSHPTKEGD